MAEMNYQSKSPPMYVWGITFILVFLVVVTSSFFVGRPFIRHNTERLQVFGLLNEIRIVAIGTSLLGNATFYDHFMSDFGREKGFDEFKYLMITKNSGLQEDFIPLMSAITEAKPKYVVIESNLVLLDINKGERFKLAIRKHKKYLRDIVFQPMRYFIGSKQKNTELARQLPDIPTTQDSAHLIRRREFTGKCLKVRDAVLPKEIEDFFVSAREQEIRIIIADVPRYEKLEEIILQSATNKQKASDLIQDLKTRYGIEYLEFPEKLGLDNYIDYAHLNQKGRERYSLWLLSCLSKL